MSIKVSVIVPVYNVEKQLSRCLDSLLAQTYQDLEVLLVDDGSKDSSGKICDQYEKKDSRFRVFHKENGGLSSARNYAIPFVTGDYLLFLDSDDSLEPQTVQVCLEATENQKYDVVCFGYRHYMEDNGSVRFIKESGYSSMTVDSKEELFRQFTHLYQAGVLGYVTDKLIRTSCLKENNVLFERILLVEDSLFTLKLFPNLNNLRAIEGCFYNYFHRVGESVTLTFKKESFDCYFERIQRIEALMRKNDCVDRAFLQDMFCSNILWVYENMFLSSCKLSLRERKKFLRTAFCKPELFPGFTEGAVQRLKDSPALLEFSSGSRKALLYVLQKKYTRLFLLHCLQLFKFKFSRKRR